jgi:hypothetical protein
MGLKRFYRPETALVILAVFSLLIASNPMGVVSGIKTLEPDDVLMDAVKKTDNGKALFLSSFDDFYDIELNVFNRRQVGESNAEAGYVEILQAASLGDEYFNDFLIAHKITHVLVPLKSSLRGEIRYKWGEIGAIQIRLAEPFFHFVLGTSSDYPSVLYEVVKQANDQTNEVPNPSYSLNWGRSIRNSFYQVQRTMVEDGFYNYKYGLAYENGLDVSWVYGFPENGDGIPERTEIAEFKFESASSELVDASVIVSLVAAYGGFAPPQTVQVTHNGKIAAYVLSPGNPANVELQLQSGDSVRFENVLPCRLPGTFDPGAMDWHKYCFGITDIRVRQKTKS